MDGILFWHWLSLGAVLVAVEVLAPGIYFLWLGIAALLVGGVSWVWPELHWQYQVLLFALFCIADVVLSRRWMRSHPDLTDQPHLNRRGEQYVGRMLTLDRPIVDGVGRIRLGDTMWRVTGPDLAAGARIRVVGVDGSTLRVEAA